MGRFVRAASVAVVALAVFGCGQASAPAEQGEELTDVLGDELAANELKVAVDGLTVWFKPVARPELRNGRSVWVISGRTSKNLAQDGVRSFVFDDVLGAGAVISARKFEIELDSQSELNSLLSGVRLYVSIQPLVGAPATATLFLAPRLDGFAGSSKIWVSTVVKPVYDGELTYRARVRTGAGSDPTVTTSDAAVFSVERRAGTTDEWNVDFDFATFVFAANPPSDPVHFRYTDSGGVLREKTGALYPALMQLGITREDAYDVWPPPECEAAVQACLDTLGLIETDTEVCGSYRQTTRCNIRSILPTLGLAPDDRSALDAALMSVRAQLPANRIVGARNFYVQGRTDRPSSLAQVATALLVQEQLTTQPLEAPISTSALNQDLAGFGAQGLVPAAQQVVFSNSFQAARVKYQRLVAAGATQRTTLELLYFPGAARLVVLELVTTEN